MQGNELYEYSADELTPGPDMLKRWAEKGRNFLVFFIKNFFSKYRIV